MDREESNLTMRQIPNVRDEEASSAFFPAYVFFFALIKNSIMLLSIQCIPESSAEQSRYCRK